MLDDNDLQPIMLDEMTTHHGGAIKDLSKWLDKRDIPPTSDIRSEVDFEMKDIRGYYVALPYIIGDVIDIIAVQEALNSRGDSIVFTDSTTQRIILRALTINLEDHVRSNLDSTDHAKFGDYQEFYYNYLSSLRELEKRIFAIDKPLPNLGGSLAMAFDRATTKISTINNMPKFASEVEGWQGKFRQYYKETASPPEMSAGDLAKMGEYISPAQRIQTNFRNAIHSPVIK